MTNRQIEETVKAALEHAAPDRLDDILASCTWQQSTAAVHEPEKVRPAAFSKIILDVNPSISLDVDENEKILSARALNEDAAALMEGMNLEGASLIETVDSIVKDMVKRGYLSEIQNSILVSVEDDNADRCGELQEKVSRRIEKVMEENLGDSREGASVISQSVDEDSELVALAEEYGISVGKAALIRKMLNREGTASAENEEKNSGKMKFEDLAGMPVNDIALLAEEENMKDDTVTHIGHASAKAYIGHKGALEKALSYAGIGMDKVHKQKIKLACKKGLMVYKVKLKTAAGKFKYILNARTGEMVRCKKNGKGKYRKYGVCGKYGMYGKHYRKHYHRYQQNNGTKGGTGMMENAGYENMNPVQMPEGSISEQQAKEAALSHAGLKESDTLYINCHPEIDHGYVEHYDVKFVANGMKYKYAIDIHTGKVLGRAVKDKRMKSGYVYEGNYHEHTAPAGTVPEKTPDEVIPAEETPAENTASAGENLTGKMMDEEEALAIALKKANLQEKDLIRWRVKLRTKHGRTVYRFKLKIYGYVYKIDVDAFSGSVTKVHEKIKF